MSDDIDPKEYEEFQKWRGLKDEEEPTEEESKRWKRRMRELDRKEAQENSSPKEKPSTPQHSDAKTPKDKASGEAPPAQEPAKARPAKRWI